MVWVFPPSFASRSMSTIPDFPAWTLAVIREGFPNDVLQLERAALFQDEFLRIGFLLRFFTFGLLGLLFLFLVGGFGLCFFLDGERRESPHHAACDKLVNDSLQLPRQRFGRLPFLRAQRPIRPVFQVRHGESRKLANDFPRKFVFLRRQRHVFGLEPLGRASEMLVRVDFSRVPRQDLPVIRKKAALGDHNRATVRGEMPRVKNAKSIRTAGKVEADPEFELNGIVHPCGDLWIVNLGAKLFGPAMTEQKIARAAERDAVGVEGDKEHGATRLRSLDLSRQIEQRDDSRRLLRARRQRRDDGHGVVIR